MTNRVWSVSGVVVLAFAAACSAEDEVPAEMFGVSSPAIMEGGMIPADHTCQGRPFPVALGNPEINWTEGPEGTQSYALVLKHLAISDGPADAADYFRGFMWAIWDIPANVRSIPANLSREQSPPEIPGAQQWSNFNQFGYFAPCPNFGITPEVAAADPTMVKTDNYGFSLYAVPTPKVDPLPPMPMGVSNYTMTLAMHLDATKLGMVQLNATSNAVPTEPPTPPDPTMLQYPPGIAYVPADPAAAPAMP